MSFRFNKQIDLNKELGLDMNKSIITLSQINKRDSLRTRGLGVSYKNSSSKVKNSRLLLIIVSSILISSLLTLGSCKNEATKPRDKWYQGGNLHKSKIIEWKNASNKNKLATCGDFCANVYKNNTINEIKLIATNLMICIEETSKDNNSMDSFPVSEIASMCLLLMEKTN